MNQKNNINVITFTSKDVGLHNYNAEDNQVHVHIS